MRIAVVLGSVTSTIKHEAYRDRILLLVQRVKTDGQPLGFPTVAIDYVGAGEGDVVLLGAAPGLAQSVLDYPKAPVQQLIMGIIDQVDLANGSFDLDRIASQIATASIHPAAS